MCDLQRRCVGACLIKTVILAVGRVIFGISTIGDDAVTGRNADFLRAAAGTNDQRYAAIGTDARRHPAGGDKRLNKKRKNERKRENATRQFTFPEIANTHLDHRLAGHTLSTA